MEKDNEMIMEQKELKTIKDYNKSFLQLANDCKKHFGADKIEIYIDDNVRIEFR